MMCARRTAWGEFELSCSAGFLGVRAQACILFWQVPQQQMISK